VADFNTLGADDEAAWLRSVADFDSLAPRNQPLASGSDGVLSGWDLTSVSVPNFASRGIGPGSIVRLLGVAGVNSQTRKDIEPRDVAVDTADTALHLRNPGLPAGYGQPPSYPGLVPFQTRTVVPQLRIAAARIKLRYNLTAENQLRSPTDLVDLTVAMTFMALYFEKSRNAGRDDDFIAKYKLMRLELIDLFAEADLRYPRQPTRGRVGAGDLGIHRPDDSPRFRGPYQPGLPGSSGWPPWGFP
jgi:hypothetical protein